MSPAGWGTAVPARVDAVAALVPKDCSRKDSGWLQS